MSLFTQAKVFRNIKELEAFLVENGLRTPQVNKALDRLETMLSGTDKGVRYDNEPTIVELSLAAQELKERVQAARKREETPKPELPRSAGSATREQMEAEIQAEMSEEDIKFYLDRDLKELMEENPDNILGNTDYTIDLLPRRIAYQETKGKTTLVFGTLGENVYTVSSAKDSKDKYNKLTGFLVAFTKHLFDKQTARYLINAAYDRYPRNPKAFLEGVIAARLDITLDEFKDLMDKVVTPGHHAVKVQGYPHIFTVV